MDNISKFSFYRHKISDDEFDKICDLIYQKSGIKLTEKKKSLVVGRLTRILNQEGFTSFGDYFNWVKTEKTGTAVNKLIDRISTNHTHFNRESQHFTYLREEVFPELLDRIDGEMRIWCAGCATGEEAYMIAMLVSEVMRSVLHNWKVDILGTDISRSVLETAIQGIYYPQNVERLPEKVVREHFKLLPDGKYKVNDNLKKLILFRRLNLIRNVYPFKRKFHIIMCRNVMIYFDGETRNSIIQRFYNYTEEGGYLFIGHSETIGRSQKGYKYIKPAVYKRE